MDKQKKYYDVKVEAMVPTTITYRILAEDEDQAAELAKKANPTAVKPKLSNKKNLKLTVYDAGTTFIRLVRNFIGG